MISRDNEGRKVVVVLSSGRSGTSLLMQILQNFGLSLSQNLIGPHLENPDGFFEDAEIVKLHKQLFADLGVKPVFPLPLNWLSSDVVQPYRAKIKNLIRKNLDLVSGTWGFKDPRATSLLPLWIQAFKSMQVIPVFVLAVREPEAAIRSIIKQTDLPGELAELVWLFRTCDALHHCAGNCTVVHYEDWFSAPQKTGDDLAAFIGLEMRSSDVLNKIIKHNLNRAVHERYRVGNSLVHKLYDVLKDCRGSDFNRDRLMACVKECRKALDDFTGWASAANAIVNYSSRNSMNQDDAMARDLEFLTLKNNEYLKQIKQLHEKCESLSVRLHAAPQANTAVPPRADVRPLLGARVTGDGPKAVLKKEQIGKGEGRTSRLWRKFKRDPHHYFLESKIPMLRPLRHLFRVGA